MEDQLVQLYKRLQNLIESGALMPGEIINAIQSLAMVEAVKHLERIADWCDAHWTAERQVSKE